MARNSSNNSTDTLERPKSGLKEFDKVLVNVVLGRRQSSRPGVNGFESYPTHAEVVKVMSKHKVNQNNANLDNRHKLGLCLSEPGNPNHTIILLPHGKCKAGDRVPMGMTWEDIPGTDATDRNITFNLPE